MTLLDKAIQIAVEAHAGQRRKGRPIPYIAHPMEVMKAIARLGITDESVLAAAVLHDVLEDATYPLFKMVEKLGPYAPHLVTELTCIKGVDDKVAYMESFVNKDIAALVIKLVDRVCNVLDFYEDGNVDYAKKYALKAKPLFAALAQREEEIIERFGLEVTIKLYKLLLKIEVV